MEPTTDNAKGIPTPEKVVRNLVWVVNIDIVDRGLGTPDERRFIVYDDFFNYRGLGATPEDALVNFFARNCHDYSDGSGLYLPGNYSRHSPASLADKLMTGEGGSNQVELEPTANPNLPTME